MPRNLAQKLTAERKGQPREMPAKRKTAPTGSTGRNSSADKSGLDRSRDVNATEVSNKHRSASRRTWKAEKAVESQMLRQFFAKNFRAARKDAGLSQRDIQMKTGIPQSHISEIESAMHNICIETMVKLANLVHVPVHELLKP